MTQVIDGKAFAGAFHTIVRAHADALDAKGHKPSLTAILVGDDPASHVYVGSKAKQAARAGVQADVRYLPKETDTATLLALLSELNADETVHGILVQLPLPTHIDEQAVIAKIAPEKDVDGFQPIHAGRLHVLGPEKARVPCTPLGAWLLLKTYVGDLSGMDAVVVGRSNIVGKPMAALLTAESCTTTVVHSRTRHIETVCARADIVVGCCGVPEMIKPNWVKEGAVLIDVGINRIERDGRSVLTGDIDPAAHARASYYTPVPGGIGPMTIACLLANTVCAAYAQYEGTQESGYARMQTITEAAIADRPSRRQRLQTVVPVRSFFFFL